MIKISICTISDRCFEKIQNDVSGELLYSLINDFFSTNDKPFLIEKTIIPDEFNIITSYLREKALISKLIITTGGTGIGKRDLTPQAAECLFRMKLPGLVQLMMNYSLKKTHLASLSRMTAGVIDSCLVLCFPGNPSAVKDCFKSVLGTINHALDILADDNIPIQLKHDEQSKMCCKHSQTRNSSLAYVKNDDQRENDGHSRIRNSKYKMIDFLSALKIIKETSFKLFLKENISIKDCFRRIIADDIKSPIDFPSLRTSTKDGYLIFEQVKNGDLLEVVQKLEIGKKQEENSVFEKGYCVAISTGSCLPINGFSIVPVEHTLFDSYNTNNGVKNEKIKMKIDNSYPQNIREIGSDFKKDTILLKKNTLITASEIGLLATASLDEISCFKQIKIGLLSTGDEIVDSYACHNKAAFQIFDTNIPMLENDLKSMNFVKVIKYGIIEDKRQELLDALKKAIYEDECQIIITTGSLSMGEKDMMKTILADDLNAKINFGRINFKPGKPTTYSTIYPENCQNPIQIFSLPGNPVSCWIMYNLLIKYKLVQLYNNRSFPILVKAIITKDINQSVDGRPEAIAAIVTLEHDHDLYGDIQYKATPLNAGAGRCSSNLKDISNCNAFILLDGWESGQLDDIHVLSCGSSVNCFILHN